MTGPMIHDRQGPPHGSEVHEPAHETTAAQALCRGVTGHRLVRMGEPTVLAYGAILRRAEPRDLPEILQPICGLAGYEREPDVVETTVDDLAAALFGPAPAVRAHVVETEGRLAGIAVWFLNFSTWTGKHGVYLEDLYVDPASRGCGYGLALQSAAPPS